MRFRATSITMEPIVSGKSEVYSAAVCHNSAALIATYSIKDNVIVVQLLHTLIIIVIFLVVHAYCLDKDVYCI